MRVCVIVPCHNAERYIGEALESVLAQTHADTTALVVDDGSTDATARIARSFGARVTVIGQSNSGPSAARNRALDATEAECVAFLDADDCWHVEKVARQVAFLRANPDCGLVHTAIRHIDADGRVTGRPGNAPLRRRTHGDCLAELLSRNTITTSSVMLRRAALGDDRFFPELRVAEDWDLWLRLAARSRFGYVDEELTDYRFHDSNTVRGRQRMLLAELVVLERTAAWLREPGHLRAARARRGRVFADLGHLAYAQGDLQRARRCFRDAGRFLDRDGLVEYLAVLLPGFLRNPARRCWHRVVRPHAVR
jgi:glycosyltransferase involved in cell wall biosynthesis